MVAEIGVGPPMPVPAGVDQHRLALDVEALEARGVDREAVLPRLADDDPGQSRRAIEREAGKVLAIGIAVERAVEIGAGVGDHVDPADLEGRAVVVIGGRSLALPEVADVRPGQALVGRHAMLRSHG